MTTRHRPPRLPQIFQRYNPPLYFVTFCTANRQRVLARADVHEAFRRFCERGCREHGVGVGGYVIMPDHVHLFVRLPPPVRLGRWVGELRRAMGSVLRSSGSGEATPGRATVWQDGFFDHVVRGNESYGEKWRYVRMNPVRAGLVARIEEWPYIGEIVAIDRA